jgi:CBS domain containing-hemolysin-like protein
VPVYSKSLDNITGIIFAHDLLQIPDSQAASRTVAQLQRPAAFVPETKKVAELLREMQQQKQHMSIVVDEYGGVAGLVTIEDLIEAIVGEIADEHEVSRDDDIPVREADGSYVVPGSFEISRLRDLFADQLEPSTRPAEDIESTEPEEFVSRDSLPELHLPEHYESTTVGGLVSEMAGHIPLPGEVVEEDGLRLEVLASTDRRIDRIRVRLNPPQAE